MRKILFTGAQSGIAMATIKKLLNEDYYIYVTVENEKQLELVKTKMSEYNNVECFKLDITNENDREKLEELDLDILVCNAAIGEGGSIVEMPLDKVRNNFEVNVFSTFIVVQKVIKKMLLKNEGKIIMMGSLAGLMPFNFLGSYCATKASVIKLTETMKNELKIINSNVKIILIEPGLYRTGFNQVMLENKYPWMYNDSYFKEELINIREKEAKIFNLFELRSFDSIANKIYKAITCNHPRFIYRAPFHQVIMAKLYLLFKA